MKRVTIAALLLSLVGCSTNDNLTAPQPADDRMQFEAGIGTRVLNDTFEEGDTFGLYVTQYANEVAEPLQISGNWANNVAVTLDKGLWKPERDLYWPESAVDAYAYYPYMEPTSISLHPFAVQLDQSTKEGYEASDFLWAKTAGVEQSAGAIPLHFKHCGSKVVIKLVKGEDYKGKLPTQSELYIHNVVHTATIDFVNGAVVKDIYGEPTTIKAYRVDDETFEAVMVPQRVDTRLPFIELIANGVSYLLEDTFYFRAYKQHTIYLTINSNPDQVSVEIGGSVEGGWE
uniref:fimbrillin family protein n=1 Tax=Alistipes sp. TaxID=1872444 RepID=UPI004056F2F7